MFVRVIILFLFIFNSHISYLKAEIKILYKIGNEIITNVDIINEKNYLIFLRPNLRSLSKSELIKISEKSIIREIIKKKELNRVFKNTENLNFIEEVKKNLFKYKKVKNEDELKSLLIENNIEYKKIIEKMKYEGLWNELIFRKYKGAIKINETNLRNELKNKFLRDKKFEYNLSELLFDINENENLDKKYKNIIQTVNMNGFKTAVSKYSIANSSNKGGDIGWIKETLLSEKLNKILKDLKINEISRPIKYPNGYLLLKINNKKELKQELNIEKELKELINFEKNRQLNQFSLLFYKKLKQNTDINEY